MKILLATDGSEFADEAAWLLAHLPHSAPVELTILSVSQNYHIHGSLEAIEWIKKDLAAVKEKVAEDCQRIEKMFDGADVRVETVVCEGHAGTTIVNEAETRNIDLVVVGAMGHSLVDRMLLGSVSDFVATHARCSVLVVRPTGLRTREHASLNVCIAYDDSAPCKFAIEQLRAFDWRQNTRIDLLSVLALSYEYTDNPITIDTEAIKTAMLKSVEHAASTLEGVSPTVIPHFIESTHVGDGVVRFAKESGTDLLLVGDTGHGLLGRFLMGSVSRYVLRHAHCCVWIARKKQE